MRNTSLSIVVLCLCALGVAPARAAERKLEYNRDIRPILAKNCFACHGPDSAARKADLRLDQREAALKAEVIVPGKPDESPLVDRIFSNKPGQMMPPKKSLKQLTAAQKETLKRWIAQGAQYQPHWSFIAPKRPQPPAVKKSGWVRNPIDNFILAEMEKHGLTPAPEADRRTLARRLSLDLRGLPPAPEEVETFVKDTAADAYERFVDRLLRSPAWGEHRGRYWLDYARYADTHGIHFDNFREIWAYRDWVIDAFNKNKSFDQFTIEQLAGDLLPKRTVEQQVASGFNRCNITTNEGGAISEEYLVLYTRDRTETVGQVFLGLTAGCAVCHDHKFDPITQREFYSMAAFFNNTTQAAMDGNIKDTPPTMLVPRKDDRARWAALVRELAGVRQQIEGRKQKARPEFDKWLAVIEARSASEGIPSLALRASMTEGLRFQAKLSEGNGNVLNLLFDGKPRSVPTTGGFTWDAGHVAAKALKTQPGSVIELPEVGDFEKDKGFSFGAWVKVPQNVQSGAIFARMDDKHDFRGWDLWIQNGQVGAHIINKWPGNALKAVSKNRFPRGKWNHLFVTYDGSARVAGLRVYVNGVPQETAVEANTLRDSIRTSVPFKLAQRHSTSRLNGLLVQDLRLYGRALSGDEVARLASGTRAAWLVLKPAKERTAAEKEELFGWWLAGVDKESSALARKKSDLEGEQAAIRARGSIAYVTQERAQEAIAYLLFRGDYDKRRDPLKPGTPKSLPPMPQDFPKNRLGFARWLLRPEHPLTARVTVNRFWQEVYGTGLVRTSGDFGVAGELPSHPELLDWLAVEFRETGWDIKRFFKMLVCSATYRQAALTTAEKRDKDPQNRLLSRGPRFRMDAEMVRDCALATSGLLVRKVGGPSVKPYQPPGVWEAVAMIGSNTRDYRRDAGDKLYRRSMYTFWKRAAPPASMDIFNAPSRELCTVRRERTNTPLQALVTLNDIQFIEAARNLAQLSLKAAAGDDARLEVMAKRLLARPFRTEEVKVVKASLAELLGHYKANPADAKKLIAVGESKADVSLDVQTLAAWTMLANQLMNLDEVLNK